MSKSLAEYKQDLVETVRLLTLANRPNNKDLLSKEKERLEKVISEMKPVEVADKPKVLPTVTITNYAWDQSEKFVKIYLSLKGIKSLDSDNIKLSSDNNQYSVEIKNLNGKNYQYSVPKLLHEIDTFTCKVKEDMLLLMMKKSKASNWQYLTLRELKQKTEDNMSSTASAMGDKSDDPQASIMNMMKKMYDEGDDEMKKTIAKAWTDARNKNDLGGMPAMPPM